MVSPPGHKSFWLFHDESEAHREAIFHAADRVILGRFFQPKIPAAGGRPNHYPGYAVIVAFMPIFREHGLSFAEPEISWVFPVDERGRRAVRDSMDEAWTNGDVSSGGTSGAGLSATVAGVNRRGGRGCRHARPRRRCRTRAG